MYKLALKIKFKFYCHNKKSVAIALKNVAVVGDHNKIIAIPALMDIICIKLIFNLQLA